MKSIRGKINATITVIVLTLAAVMMLVMGLTARSMTTSTLLETLRPLTKVAAQSLEGNLHMLADRVFMIADSALLAGASSEQEKGQFLARQEEGIEFAWLALYTQDGRFYAGNAKSPQDISQQAFFKSMRETQNLVINDTDVSGESLEVAIGTPVAGANGYYLVGSYRYDVINDVLSNIHLGYSGYAFVINQAGVLMAHPSLDKVRGKENIVDVYAGNPKLSALFQRMRQGETAATAVFIDGRATLVSFAPVRGTNWSLAVFVPRAEFMGPARQAMGLDIAVVLALLALAAFLSTRLSGKISRPLGGVTRRLGMLAQGDLHSPVEMVATRDETEALSVSLRDTVGDIRSYISQLRGALAEVSVGNLDVEVSGSFSGDFVAIRDSLESIIAFLNGMVRELQASAGRLAVTAGTVSAVARTVDKASADQSHAVGELAASADAISRDIGAVEEGTKSASALMERAGDRLDDGGVQMGRMLEAIQRIQDNAEEITQITKFMEDIASQTNILSLNAAVEAARAGQYGKGFSVVAGEVRQLAAKSADSAQHTAQIIAHSREAIREGTQLAQDMSASMGEIADITHQVTALTGGLAAAVRSERGKLEDMAAAVSLISEQAEQNLCSSQESAAASEQLAGQSQSLRLLAGRFRLKSPAASVGAAGQDGGGTSWG